MTADRPGPDDKEGSPPDRRAGHNLLRQVASHYRGGADDLVSASGVQQVATLTLPDVVMAILESRASYPQAASAALVRERGDASAADGGNSDGGSSAVVHLVLLDDQQQPLYAAPGVIIAVTYAAQHLDSDVLAAFGDRNVIILT
jgi:hypothetical protein